MQELYIVDPKVNENHSIASYKLYKKEDIPVFCTELFRIQIPEQCTLEYFKGYFKLIEDIPIKQFRYVPMIKRNDVWKEWETVRGLEPRQYEKSLTKDGYHLVPELGYMNAKEFRAWFRKLHPELFTHNDNYRIAYGVNVEESREAEPIDSNATSYYHIGR